MDIGSDRTLKCPCCDNTKLHFMCQGDAWSMMGEESNFEAAKETDKIGPSKVKNNKFYYWPSWASKFVLQDVIPSKFFCKCGYSSTDIKDF